jgi:hypothetical protein
MPLWDGATAVLFERSSDGNTATVLGPGDAVLARCDDAGQVIDADGNALLTAAFSMPKGASGEQVAADLKRLKAQVEVTGADGAPAGSVVVRRFKATPFSKTITLGLVGPDGADVGELAAADKKGRELVVGCGGQTVATLALEDRDRGLRRTVERWSLNAQARPAAPNDLLAAAAVLRNRKLLALVA